MNKRYFITGGSGFIGTNLVAFLLSKGQDVINFDIASPRNQKHLEYWVEGDIRDKKDLQHAVGQAKPDCFIHLAARTDLDGENLEAYDANMTGVLNTIEVIEGNKTIKRALFASSRLVCKIGYTPKSDTDYQATTFYGKSKVIGEQVVRENAAKLYCDWAIFRPTSIWGPWFDTPYKEFFFAILNSLYVHPKGRKIKKSFGYVGNTVAQLWDLLSCDPDLIHGKTLYVCDYPPIEVKMWADLIAEKSGRKKPREVSLFILKTLAMIGDTLKLLGYKHPPLTKFRLNNIITNMVYDTALLETISPSLPFSIEDGVLETLKWINKYAK